MDDKIFLNVIKDTTEYEVNADFSLLMSRIENQTDEEREQSRKEALQLMPENNNPPSMNKKLRNIIGIAAAALITIGLGVSLVVASVGSYSAEAEVSYDCMEEESAPMLDAPEAVADSEIGSVFEDSKLNGAGVPDSGINTATSGTAESSFATCRVKQLGITVDLPENAYITDSTVEKDFILLEKYDISAAQLEANYKKSGIYYNAVWYDDDADATEIVITKRTDEVSEGLFNLKNAGEYDLGRIKEMYLSYGENAAISGAEYFDVSTVSNEQALFLRSLGKVDNAEERSNHLQYMTIVNGERIEITLIEHFGIDSELTGDEPAEVSEAHAEIMERVINSLKWDNIRSGFLRRYSRIVIFAAVAIVGAAAIAISTITERRKLKANKDDVVCEQEPEIITEDNKNEGSQSEEKDADDEQPAEKDDEENTEPQGEEEETE